MMPLTLKDLYAKIKNIDYTGGASGVDLRFTYEGYSITSMGATKSGTHLLIQATDMEGSVVRFEQEIRKYSAEELLTRIVENTLDVFETEVAPAQLDGYKRAGKHVN